MYMTFTLNLHHMPILFTLHVHYIRTTFTLQFNIAFTLLRYISLHIDEINFGVAYLLFLLYLLHHITQHIRYDIYYYPPVN
jgi:hypothetical protein